MMKSTGSFDLAIDGWFECLSRRSNPVDNSTLQSFSVISPCSVGALLDLRKNSVKVGVSDGAYHVPDVLDLLLG